MLDKQVNTPFIGRMDASWVSKFSFLCLWEASSDKVPNVAADGFDCLVLLLYFLSARITTLPSFIQC